MRVWRFALPLLLAACAGPRASAPEVRAAWPLPPEHPRVRLERIVDSDTLRPRRSWWRTALSWLAGSNESVPVERTFERPFHVAFAPDGTLLVADPDARAVFRIDRALASAKRVDCPGAPWRAPIAIGAVGAEKVLVADAAAGTLTLADGHGCKLLSTPGLARPTGLAVADPIAYVADPPSHAVWRVSTEGGLPSRIGTRGTGEGNFHYPTDVAVDRQGRLYVVDSMNFRIAILNGDGTWAREIVPEPDSPFAQPRGIAVGEDGSVYVTDAQSDQLLAFSPAGTLDYAVATAGERGPPVFSHPAGVAVSGRRMAVADSLNRRILIFDLVGAEE